MNDCKTCKHAQVLYAREKADRFAAAYAPVEYVRCAGPRYKGRAYFCKASRKACAEYEKRQSPKDNRTAYEKFMGHPPPGTMLDDFAELAALAEI